MWCAPVGRADSAPGSRGRWRPAASSSFGAVAATRGSGAIRTRPGGVRFVVGPCAVDRPRAGVGTIIPHARTDGEEDAPHPVSAGR
ncbi:hypothetical protein CZ771_14275 [Actinomycetales bacterium JB111]|nr:hypothetical protein CZ771_14275 [Actinomycetales bacterium JB111]